MNKENEILKDIFNKAKNVLKSVDDIIIKEMKGNDMLDYLKNKSKDVKVKVEETVEKFTTEELDAKIEDTSITLKLILPGANKENISIEIENSKLNINIDTTNISKEIRKHWSVSKNKLYFDFSQWKESVVIDDITSKFENAILTIIIPKENWKNDKKKVVIL